MDTHSFPHSLIKFSVPTLFMLVVAGCGGGNAVPEHLPPLTPLTVVVEYQGAPVEGATVLMSPESGQFAAAGTTDAEGKAVMKTDSQYEGVVADRFKVTVAKQEIINVDLGPTPEDPAEYAAYEKKLKSLPKPKNLLPDKYASFGTSKLSITVTEGTPGEEVLKLED
ncbi:carboxypeptidase regulatory-like domain-containing protein [Blastopirellula marina]|uniref:Carboxypeptidase regulatory-like domain-containing protein n=1 Tax=Blastopirellula marina TaxID=124 RepID=A0A2S8FHY8_9BACT|nr:carboxypeptidase regulatory-like domain-containing protein [Blastopirellula marina]PQO31776.1 hypothetical protein C5Y98_20425 [Blastopirellula marina]PTL43083.1 carboxypeptidase regulatory-like domain-containing protein [Blastopirellula marina]